MKVTPVAHPAQIKDMSTPDSVRTAKAVEAFNKGQSSYDKAPPVQANAQETPVQNPNAVSVEELGAIQAKSEPQIDKVTEVAEETQAPAEATKSEPPKQDPALADRFNKLARQERALRAKVQQQEQALNAREQAIKAREDALTVKDNQYRDGYISKDRVKADALSVLDEAGVSYDELTQQIINRQPTDPRVMSTISKLEAKIAQLEASAEDSQKSYKEQQQASYQAAVKQIGIDAKNLIKNNPQDYEAIASTGSVKDIVELITKTYEKYGNILTVEEAAQEVENEIVEQGLKISQISKIKQRMNKSNASAQASTQQTQAPKQQTQPTSMKTLTNATASSRQLSSKERAILAFKGELKG